MKIFKNNKNSGSVFKLQQRYINQIMESLYPLSIRSLPTIRNIFNTPMLLTFIQYLG
jgi:hypothetical protein